MVAELLKEKLSSVAVTDPSSEFSELAFAAIDAVEHFVERGALEQVWLVDAEAGCERARGFVGVGSGRAEVGEYGFG